MDIQGSVYLGDYLREGQGCAGLKQESWAGVGMGVEGEDGGAGWREPRHTHLPFPVHSCPEIVPKGSATTAVVFPCTQPEGAGSWWTGGTPISSSEARQAPCFEFEIPSSPSQPVLGRVAPWPR